MKPIRGASIALVFLLLAACADGEPSFTRDRLPSLVLQADDAPIGTKLVDGSSGEQDLDEYAESEDERTALAAAGFQVAYLNLFLSPRLFQGGDIRRITRDGALAISFALLFDDAEGAAEGLRIVEQDVRADGSDLLDRPTDDLPAESFGVVGTLEQGFPPGYLFAWRRGNAVFGLAAMGAKDAINETAVRTLVREMLDRVG